MDNKNIGNKYNSGGFDTFFRHVHEGIYPELVFNKKELQGVQETRRPALAVTSAFLYPLSFEGINRSAAVGGEVRFRGENQTVENTLLAVGSVLGRALDTYLNVTMASIIIGNPLASIGAIAARGLCSVVEYLAVRGFAWGYTAISDARKPKIETVPNSVN